MVVTVLLLLCEFQELAFVAVSIDREPIHQAAALSLTHKAFGRSSPSTSLVATMSYMLPHLHSGWAVDQAILNEVRSHRAARRGRRTPTRSSLADASRRDQRDAMEAHHRSALQSSAEAGCLDRSTGELRSTPRDRFHPRCAAPFAAAAAAAHRTHRFDRECIDQR